MYLSFFLFTGKSFEMFLLIIAASICVSESKLTEQSFVPYITGPWQDFPFVNKCYTDLGCFYTGSPFFNLIHRPLSCPPDDDIPTEYLLFNPVNIHEPYRLNLSAESVATAHIDPDHPLKIIIHGYNVNVEPNDTRYRIKEALLKHGDYNVIIIDWSKSNQPPYPQAVANGRVVGAQIALLVNYLQQEKKIRLDDIHIIGHSLGAHIAGWAGERLRTVARITGLDPAGPYFQDAPPEVRLDKTDAKFLDVIHTNGANNFIQGFGLAQAIGDIDFYPNGGNHQPGCLTNLEIEEQLLEGFEHLIASSCDHSRAYEYFISSIHDCQYPSVMCNNYQRYTLGKCTDQNSNVTRMGYHTPIRKRTDAYSRFYLRTTSTTPFCETESSSSLSSPSFLSLFYG